MRYVPTPRKLGCSSRARRSAPASLSGTANAAKSSELRTAAAKISSDHSSRKFPSPSHSGRRTRSHSKNAVPNVASAGTATSATSPRTYGASMSASTRRSRSPVTARRPSARRRGGCARGGARGRRCRLARRGSRRPTRATTRCPSERRWRYVSLPASSTTSTRAGISPPSATCSGRIPASSGTPADPTSNGNGPARPSTTRQTFIAGVPTKVATKRFAGRR